MFTGIIEDLGVVDAAAGNAGAGRIVVRSRLAEGLELGRSIAVNGVCLTVVHTDGARFACDVLEETLRRSNLRQAARGARVNLERAMRLDGRLEGHIVQGHADGVGRLTHVRRAGADREIVIDAPPEVARYIVVKGSIAVDGISMTVARFEGSSFAVRVIPHTWEATNLSHRRAGDVVNLEADILAKYVERLCGDASPGVTLQKLRDAGFLDEAAS